MNMNMRAASSKAVVSIATGLSSTSTTTTTVPLNGEPRTKMTISLAEFANEIFQDLQTLMQTYPNGIMLTDLQSYYGESRGRVLNAAKLLQKVGKIVIDQNGNGSYFILPFAEQDKLILSRLSDLQKKVLSFLVRICREHKTNRVQTGYFQLARVLTCSVGGVNGTIHRLEIIGHLKILQDSTRGRQNELLLEISQMCLNNPHVFELGEKR